jgi:hypothetical protein
MKGIADVIGIAPDGTFISVEIKGTESDRQRPSQREFQNNIERRNGKYYLVRNLSTFIEEIKEDFKL